MNDNILSVLIVEDEPLLQDVYRMVLSSQGYKVATASNGIQALSELKKHEPDVLLLDYFMPQMDGRTFMLNFDRSEYEKVTIVVLSNISDEPSLEEMLELGANSYVLKSSIAPSDLIELVENAASKKP